MNICEPVLISDFDSVTGHFSDMFALLSFVNFWSFFHVCHHFMSIFDCLMSVVFFCLLQMVLHLFVVIVVIL